MKKQILKLTAWVLVSVMAGNPSVWAMAKRPPMPPAEVSAAQPKRLVTLDKAYELALRRSEVIAIKREEISKTWADWFKASGEAIGNADLVMTNFQQDSQRGGGGGEGSVGSTLSASERRERKIVFSQPLFQGFKSAGALVGAGSLRKQRQEEHLRAKEVLFLEVVDAFYGLMQQKKDVETIEGIHDLLQERIEELKQREGVGRSRRSELSTAESKMKILEAQLAKARGAHAIGESLMEFYTGLSPEEVSYEEESLKGMTVAKPENFELLAEDRSDVEAAHQAERTAKQAIVVAQSGLWPAISLDANHYEHREGFQADIDWDLLFKIDVPLFKGGETVGEIKEAYSEWRQAQLNHSLVKRQAELEIKSTYQDWIAAQEQDKAFAQAVKAAQENYRLQKEDYVRSLVNNLDVLSALEELFNTSREANRVHYVLKQNYWRYQTAIGGCCDEADAENTEPQTDGAES